MRICNVKDKDRENNVVNMYLHVGNLSAFYEELSQRFGYKKTFIQSNTRSFNSPVHMQFRIKC